MGQRFSLCTTWYELFTMFFLLLLFFPSPCSLIMLLWPHSVLCHHPRRISAFLPILTPPLDCSVHSRGLQPEASPAGTKTAAVHDTCSPKTPLFASFHSSSPFISLLLFQPTLSFSPLVPLGTGDPPRGPVLNPSLTLHAASSSVSLDLHWNPDVSDNQRHLSREPATQIWECLKERSELGESQWKEAKGQLLRKTFQILSVNQAWQPSSACHQVQKLKCIKNRSGFIDPHSLQSKFF